ncbi:MAG: CRISPR-associated helicase Cas3', partial [Armatimonadetes bacterium]|nr:CRISPR-associated helicase Cas3' [Armatimonadota bacterium]
MLLAKSEQVNGKPRYQTLVGHTKDVLWLMDGLTRSLGFRLFCCRWGLDKKDVQAVLTAIAALHDIGKATRPFQQAIREGKHLTDIPHALIALPVAYEVWKQIQLPCLYEAESLPLVELLTIVSHHALLYDGLYQNAIKPLQRLDFEPEAGKALSEIFFWAAEQFNLPHFKTLQPLPFGEWAKWELKKCSEALEKLRNVNRKLIKSNSDTSSLIRLKALYTFLLAHLKFTDHWASRNFSEKSRELPCETVNELLPNLPKWQIPDDAEERVFYKLPEPYHFQEQLSQTDETQVVVLAPCGRGKTEGALLWFLHQRALGNCERLIIAMPTQVTSNAMHRRLADLFGEDNVGLYHGRSSLEHRELVKLKLAQVGEGDDLDPEIERELAQSENFWSEVFAKPITVTTADHLLFTFVHGFRQADFALGCLQTAAIVFDEVHCYDRKMLAELRELFKLLRAMKIPHLLMSGTLPQFLVNETCVSDYRHISDDDGLIRKPFILRKRDEKMFLRIEAEDTNLQPNGEIVKEVVEGFKRD